MRKILFPLAIVLGLVSCSDDTISRKDEVREYVSRKQLWCKDDSTFTSISRYTDVVKGHTIIIYKYNVKYGGNNEVIHDVNICEKCLKRKEK